MAKVKVWVTLALVALVALFAVACGGGTTITTAAVTETTAVATDTTAATAPAQITTVNVGINPYQGTGPIWLGDEKGFFKEHGLKLNFIPAVAPAPIMASVQSGQEDFGFATTAALISAIAGGLELVGVSPDNGTLSLSASQTAIIVGPNSTIKTAADLAGKTVAVPGLGSWIDLLVYTAADRAGVDWKSVHTVQVPFPTMWSAVKAGRVDAAGITEPFRTQALADGAKVISEPDKEIAGGHTATLFVTTRKYASANPQVVQAFRAAMQESIVYSGDHLDEMHTIIATKMGTDLSVVQSIEPPVFDPKFNRDGMTTIANLMVKYGFIKQAPTVDQILLPES